MKQIFTSYLNNRKVWDEPNITAVQVCRWVFDGQRKCDTVLTDVFPPKELILLSHEDKVTWEEYVAIYYKAVLDTLDPTEIVEQLPDICVLMCHEASPEHCHRSLIGKWLEENTGVKVEEWMPYQEREYTRLVDTLVEF